MPSAASDSGLMSYSQGTADLDYVGARSSIPAANVELPASIVLSDPYAGRRAQAPTRRRHLLIGGAVAAAAAVVVALLAWPDQTSIAMPRHIFGLDRVQYATLKGIPTAFEDTAPSGQRLLGTYADAEGIATVELYAAKSSRAASDVGPELSRLESAFDQRVPGVAFRSVAAGHLGGQMACGAMVVAGAPGTVCFFVDTHALGGMLFVQDQNLPTNAVPARQAIEKRG